MEVSSELILSYWADMSFMRASAASSADWASETSSAKAGAGEREATKATLAMQEQRAEAACFTFSIARVRFLTEFLSPATRCASASAAKRPANEKRPRGDGPFISV